MRSPSFFGSGVDYCRSALKQARSRNALRRCEAVLRLTQSAAESTEALDGLTRLLDDPDGRVCEIAAQAFAAILPHIDSAHVELHDSELDTIAYFMCVCRADGVPGVWFPVDPLATLFGVNQCGQRWLRENFHDLWRALRDYRELPEAGGYEIYQLVPRLGATAAELITEYLRDADEEVRKLAANTLEQMGPTAWPAISALIRSLDDAHEEDPEVRSYAADALGAIGPAAREAAPHLLTHWKSGRVCSASCAAALGRIGDDRPETVSALIEALSNRNDVDLRTAAAGALGRLGNAIGVAIPTLNNLLVSDPQVRFVAALALARLGERPGRDFVTERVRDGHFGYGHFCDLHDLLELVGGANKETVELLKEILPRWETDVADVLRTWGAKATEFVLEFVELLRNAPSHRSSAARMLGVIGPGARFAVPDLLELLDDTDLPTRVAAVEALSKIAPEKTAALPRLLALLEHQNRACYAPAVESLGRLGPAAKVALPRLLKLAETKPGDLSLIVDAIGRIDPDPTAVVLLLETCLKSDKRYLVSAADMALQRMAGYKVVIPRYHTIVGMSNSRKSRTAPLVLGLVLMSVSVAAAVYMFVQVQGNYSVQPITQTRQIDIYAEAAKQVKLDKIVAFQHERGISEEDLDSVLQEIWIENHREMTPPWLLVLGGNRNWWRSTVDWDLDLVKQRLLERQKKDETRRNQRNQTKPDTLILDPGFSRRAITANSPGLWSSARRHTSRRDVNGCRAPAFRGWKPTATSRCRDAAPPHVSGATEGDAHSPEFLVPFIPSSYPRTSTACEQATPRRARFR